MTLTVLPADEEALPDRPPQQRAQIMAVLDGKCWWDIAANDRDGVWTEYCPTCRCPLLPGERVKRSKRPVDGSSRGP